MTPATHMKHPCRQHRDGWHAAYCAAYEAAQPDAVGAVVPVHLELRESEWEFQRGVASRAWVINGTVPGPTLEARVGDVLEIRLTNRMAEPTVLHWHGLRIPAAMDGTEAVQRPVGPGETFTYRYRVPDAGTPGTTRTSTRRSSWSAAYTAR